MVLPKNILIKKTRRIEGKQETNKRETNKRG